MNNKKGLTLIEVIVAMAIIGIISIYFTPVFVYGFRNIFRAGHKSEAIYNAQAGIEQSMSLTGRPNTTTISIHIPEMDSIAIEGRIEEEDTFKLFIPKR